MSDCQYQSDLEAYHDGELDAGASQRLSRHLHECGRCEAELREMRRLSDLLAGLRPAGGMAPLQRARLHQTLEHRGPQRLLRLTKFVAAAAASVLLIAGAWLWEMPAGRPNSGPVAQTTIPDWERVAVTLEVDPPPDVAADTRFAEAHFTDWIMGALNENQP